jgi:hypothetical protein
MTFNLTDQETATLARLLSEAIDADRYPVSPRIHTLKGILAKIRAGTRTATAAEALRAAARYSGQKASGGALALKSEPGRLATLGSSAAARVRLIA